MDNIMQIIIIVIVVFLLLGCSCSCKGMKKENFGRGGKNRGRNRGRNRGGRNRGGRGKGRKGKGKGSSCGRIKGKSKYCKSYCKYFQCLKPNEIQIYKPDRLLNKDGKFYREIGLGDGYWINNPQLSDDKSYLIYDKTILPADEVQMDIGKGNFDLETCKRKCDENENCGGFGFNPDPDPDQEGEDNCYFKCRSTQKDLEKNLIPFNYSDGYSFHHKLRSNRKCTI